MGRTWAIIEREMRRFRRSPILIAMSMVMPIVQLVVLGYAFGGNVKHLKLAIVDHGQLKALDTPFNLKAAVPAQNLVEVSFSAVPPGFRQRLEGLPEVEAVSGEDHVLRISTRNGPATTLALMEEAARADITVHSLSVHGTSLDDVFVHYTGHDLRDELQAASAQDSPFMLRRG